MARSMSRLLAAQVSVTERLPSGAKGLDFGSGPGPALACMLRESGYEVALYDSFYEPDEAVLNDRYDFICATEVVEHLSRPGWELHRLCRIANAVESTSRSIPDRPM